MNACNPSTEDVNAADALHAISGLVHRMAMKLIVLELALREAIATMPPDQKQRFSSDFKARAALAMQNSAQKLMPMDDSEISLAVANLLEASK